MYPFNKKFLRNISKRILAWGQIRRTSDLYGRSNVAKNLKMALLYDHILNNLKPLHIKIQEKGYIEKSIIENDQNIILHQVHTESWKKYLPQNKNSRLNIYRNQYMLFCKIQSKFSETCMC